MSRFDKEIRVHITFDMHEDMKRYAINNDITMAEVVRRGVDKLLSTKGRPEMTMEEKAASLLSFSLAEWGKDDTRPRDA